MQKHVNFSLSVLLPLPLLQGIRLPNPFSVPIQLYECFFLQKWSHTIHLNSDLLSFIKHLEKHWFVPLMYSLVDSCVCPDRWLNPKPCHCSNQLSYPARTLSKFFMWQQHISRCRCAIIYLIILLLKLMKI